jgi:hypothetical protein
VQVSGRQASTGQEACSDNKSERDVPKEVQKGEQRGCFKSVPLYTFKFISFAPPNEPRKTALRDDELAEGKRTKEKEAEPSKAGHYS